MHKIDVRLGSTDSGAPEFEVSVERLKDGTYVAFEEPMKVKAEQEQITKLLDPDERLVIVAKKRGYKMVYDREQNANIRVEDKEEDKPHERPLPGMPVEAPLKAGQPATAPQTSPQKPAVPGGPPTSNVQGARDSTQVKK